MKSEFRFKQFAILQNKKVFKVGTDAVLCGALTSMKGKQSVLEIGTGTGIIAMMYAQRNPMANIIALEPHIESFRLANENVNNSPFHQQIKILPYAFQEYKPLQSFDLIISNPPYFQESEHVHQKHDHARSRAHLNFEELFELSNNCLSPKGTLEIIFPFDQREELLASANRFHLFPYEMIMIKGNARTKVRRIFVKFSKKKRVRQEKLLIIEKERGIYTTDYIALTKDFHPMF